MSQYTLYPLGDFPFSNLTNNRQFLLVFCEGLETVAQGISITSSGIEIKFNHVTGIDSHVDLMGYKVLYKRTDTNEWWRAVDIRGGYRTRTISGLKPYKNYSIRVAPYSFRAGGLAGPIVINETKEDGR